MTGQPSMPHARRVRSLNYQPPFRPPATEFAVTAAGTDPIAALNPSPLPEQGSWQRGDLRALNRIAHE